MATARKRSFGGRRSLRIRLSAPRTSSSCAPSRRGWRWRYWTQRETPLEWTRSKTPEESKPSSSIRRPQRRCNVGTKYIFITGGVVSGLGKGIAAASMGALLEARGFRVTLQKFDPYLNVDPGTMSPFQHGEVYVTDDGAETDLDLGHYERFTSTKTTKAHNWTAGRIYESVIAKERKGEYLGKTVQVIPHVTDMIKSAVEQVAADNDIVICEIGGTVGDIEGLPFFEAIRQLGNDLSLIHISE